jgi:hypothetical protein
LALRSRCLCCAPPSLLDEEEEEDEDEELEDEELEDDAPPGTEGEELGVLVRAAFPRGLGERGRGMGSSQNSLESESSFTRSRRNPEWCRCRRPRLL